MKKILIITVMSLVTIAAIAAIVLSRKSGGQAQSNVAGLSTTSSSNVSVSAPTSSIPKVDRFPHDQDRDGLTDEEEKKLGTSDQEFDTDHDGLSDYDEVKVWKTDPTKADTDGDGYSDGVEVVGGYNPLGKGKL